jgi:hypothetical protein
MDGAICGAAVLVVVGEILFAWQPARIPTANPRMANFQSGHLPKLPISFSHPSGVFRPKEHIYYIRALPTTFHVKGSNIWFINCQLRIKQKNLDA